jgi:hypothetical protein
VAGFGVSLAAIGGAARLAAASGGGAASVAAGGVAMMTAGGGETSSADGAGLASESGGEREVWQLALSGNEKLPDKNPMAISAAFLIRISENRF